MVVILTILEHRLLLTQNHKYFAYETVVILTILEHRLLHAGDSIVTINGDSRNPNYTGTPTPTIIAIVALTLNACRNPNYTGTPTPTGTAIIAQFHWLLS